MFKMNFASGKKNIVSGIKNHPIKNLSMISSGKMLPRALSRAPLMKLVINLKGGSSCGACGGR